MRGCGRSGLRRRPWSRTTLRARPQAVRNEAVIRFAGYLAEAPFGAIRTESVGPLSSEAVTITRPCSARAGGGVAHALEGAPGRGDRMMRWPWPWAPKGVEKREGGSYSDIIIRWAEAQAAGTAADAASTAAVEAVSGALSRAFASATVEGPPWAVEAVTPAFLALVGRDLVRRGQSLHVLRIGDDGRVRLLPAADWSWQDGTDDPDSWNVRATTYGPAASVTRLLPAAGVVFVAWSTTAGTPYAGTGPLRWASTTARLNAQSERSIADEASGPVAQILPVPQDGGDGGDDDPLAELKADIAAAKGRAVLTETTSAGWGEGRMAAPAADWRPQRLGPQPTEAQARVARDSFERVLAACGYPPSLSIDSDGTSQAPRRFDGGTLGRWLRSHGSSKTN